MIKAYVISRCNAPEKISSLTELLKKVRAVKGVKQAHSIIGLHEGIGYLEVEDHDQLLEALDQVIKIDGVDALDVRLVWPQY